MDFREIIENISPILIRPKQSALTIGISKRFFLFQMMNRIVNAIQEDPHINFIAFLKGYKVLGRILTGTLHEMYRDRNQVFFKNFFTDRHVYMLVKSDIEQLHPKYKDLRVTLTKRGVIIYENYKKNKFNVLLLTIHSGTWVPDSIAKKMKVSDSERVKEEDIDTHKLYRNIVLEKGGIWIDNKLSRFAIDFNRTIEGAVYDTYLNDAGEHVKVWAEELSAAEYRDLFTAYREFYFTLARLLDAYQFNIIFDGHSMKDKDNRPNISFGTRYIPVFYTPIVRSMQHKIASMGYSPVQLNSPYGGGFILKWLSTLYPNVFVFSMEINKNLYMTKDRRKSIEADIQKLSDDVVKIFDIEPEPVFANAPERKDRATAAAKYIRHIKKG